MKMPYPPVIMAKSRATSTSVLVRPGAGSNLSSDTDCANLELVFATWEHVPDLAMRSVERGRHKKNPCANKRNNNELGKTFIVFSVVGARLLPVAVLHGGAVGSYSPHAVARLPVTPATPVSLCTFVTCSRRGCHVA
jgi:hypothetical protein